MARSTTTTTPREKKVDANTVVGGIFENPEFSSYLRDTGGVEEHKNKEKKFKIKCISLVECVTASSGGWSLVWKVNIDVCIKFVSNIVVSSGVPKGSVWGSEHPWSE